VKTARTQTTEPNNTPRARSGATRRQFLAASAAASIGLPYVLIPKLRAVDAPAPSDRITVALIGHGVMGRGHLRRLLGDSGVQVLAVCDVDTLRRNGALQRAQQAYSAASATGTYKATQAYDDYRRILERPDIDAVVVVTPDHWHTPISVDAARAGKDIYCEKPISLTVAQGRRLVDVVQRYSRVFQTGTQYRSIPTIRRVVEFVRKGGLGPIKHVFTLWSSLAGWINSGRFKPWHQYIPPQKYASSYVPLDVQLPGQPVPDGLNWPLWVGPSPWRDYHPLYHVNPAPGVVPWSFCEDFGSASVTWHHSHSADVIQYALGVETSGPVEFIPPSTGEYPTMTCRYANGTLLHLVDHWGMVKNVYKAVPPHARLAGNFGGVFVGQRGWVTSMTTGGPIEGEPADIFQEMGLKTRQVNVGENNHHANWFECIRTRQRPSCHEELGHRSAALGHLTIIAFKLGRTLRWDPKTERFEGDDEANRLLSRPMRAPWHL